MNKPGAWVGDLTQWSDQPATNKKQEIVLSAAGKTRCEQNFTNGDTGSTRRSKQSWTFSSETQGFPLKRTPPHADQEAAWKEWKLLWNVFSSSSSCLILPHCWGPPVIPSAPSLGSLWRLITRPSPLLVPHHELPGVLHPKEVFLLQRRSGALSSDRRHSEDQTGISGGLFSPLQQKTLAVELDLLTRPHHLQRTQITEYTFYSFHATVIVVFIYFFPFHHSEQILSKSLRNRLVSKAALSSDFSLVIVLF